jgi:DNA-binding LacI/PurR family transcriptional regulator
LTAQAKRAGMTVSQYISNPPKGITATTKRRIAEAKTLRKLHK